MRILITGGAGCLGSNLVEHWLPRGHTILALDNFATGKRAVFPAVPRLVVVEGSVADWDLVKGVFSDFKPTHVVHSAAAYKDASDWREDAATNVTGSINVARASEAAGVRRLINFQTALCYGRPQRTPIPIDHPIAPFTSYGISKAAGERYIFMTSTSAVSLRIANVTGPRLAIGPIPTFYQRLKSGQKCFCSDTRRDFLDMSDFIALMDLVIQDSAPTGQYNVSTGEAHSIKEIFDEVCSYLGARPSEDVPIVPVGPDDVPVVVLDPSHTERTFGWKARVGFKDAIRRQLDWYSEHGVSDVYSHLVSPRA